MHTSMIASRVHRSLGLDLLRLIAVLLVIGRHAYLPDTAPIFLKLWRRAGWMGVDLFFVLSGFLVSSLLFHEYQANQQIRLSRFLIRRGFKIYPAFWFFIAATVAGMCFAGQQVQWARLAAELCFVQNYFPGLWNHTWSLAVEEHFYLFIGLAVSWLAGRSQVLSNLWQVPILCIGVMGACWAARLANLLSEPFNMRAFMFPSHLRFDSLMAGVLLAYLVAFRQLVERTNWIPSWVLFAVGGSLFFPGVVGGTSHPWVTVHGFVPIYCGAAVLTLLALRIPQSRNTALSMAGKVGAHSYSIYLWHMPILLWSAPFIASDADSWTCTLFLAANILVILAVGVLLSLAVETPFLRLRDRCCPRGFANIKAP